MKTFTSFLCMMFLFLGFYSQAQISKQINFSTNDVTTRQITTQDRISMPNTHLLYGEGHVGQPQLPVKTINLALPQNAKATSVSIATGQLTSIQGTFDIPLVQPPKIMGAHTKPSARPKQNDAVYCENASFPGDPLLSFSNHQSREYSYVSVNFIPFSYKPQSGQLGLYRQLTISVSYTGGGAAPAQEGGRPKDHADAVAYKNMQQVVANPDDFQQFYAGIPPFPPSANNSQPGRVFDPGDLPSRWGSSVPYVIITNNTDVSGALLPGEDQENPSTLLTHKFQEFADWKTRKGTPAKVVTVDTILKTYKGVDPNKPQNFNICA